MHNEANAFIFVEHFCEAIKMYIVLILFVNGLEFWIGVIRKLSACLWKNMVEPIYDCIYFIRETQLEHLINFPFSNGLLITYLPQFAIGVMRYNDLLVIDDNCLAIKFIIAKHPINSPLFLFFVRSQRLLHRYYIIAFQLVVGHCAKYPHAFSDHDKRAIQRICFPLA